MRPTGTTQQLEQRRRRAIALLEAGQGVRETARQIGASPSSVTHWRQAYEKEGEKALTAHSPPGRPPQLTARQCDKLARLLLQGPQKHGYANALWTLPRIAEVIRKHFGVTYDPSSVWHVLHRMGWSCQKPERRARERDEERIAAWRTDDWPRIKKRQKKR
jgi:transposase